MSNKQKTAVDWLFSELQRMQYFICNDMLEAYKDAKEMEKQEMINFADNYGFYVCGYDYERAEQYYKETYE